MQFFTTAALQSLLVVLVAGNQAKFYPRGNCNGGEYSGCYNLAENTCCRTASNVIFGLSISKGPLDFAQMWSGGGCTRQQCSAGGSGTLCCVVRGTVGLTGGSFYTLRGKRDEEAQTNCTSTMEHNMFGYSDAGVAWEIREDTHPDSFAQLQRQFESLRSANKLAWLQAHGAVLSIVDTTEPIETTIVTVD